MRKRISAVFSWVALLPLLGLSEVAAAAPAAAAARASKPAAAAARASKPAGPAPTAGTPRKLRTIEGITEYALDNGLKVLLFPDASKPAVTVNVTYFVGSRHEGYGETGMAHLLEHMLFKGTPKHDKIWTLLQNRGANFNGTTAWDRTNYYETLPASDDNLDFALGLEADRMVNSKIAASDLATEFSVVRNEFEMGENNPQMVLEERMLSTAYLWHNYGKSPIGSRSDIERVPADSLRAFYELHYQPDNAMLVVAGKFDPSKALALVQKYFAPIPRPARKLSPTYTLEPQQDGERVVTLRRTGDVPLVGLVYHGSAAADPDHAAEDAAMTILFDKPSGRAYKALVGKQLASEVWGYTYPLREPGVMAMGAKLLPGQSPEKARDALIKVVEGLATEPVSEAEVARFRSQASKNFDLLLADSDRAGIALTEAAAAGDWRLLFLDRDRAERVTPADVQRVAKKFLKGTNRTVGIFYPTKDSERAPLETTPDVQKMVADYKGQGNASEGEAFAATIQNVEQRTKRLQLSNGMKVALLSKKTRGNAVKLALSVHFGSEAELKGKTTASNLIGEMLIRGTKKHSYQALKDAFDELKADVQFGGGGPLASELPGDSVVRVTTTRENLPKVLALIGEALREPIFPPAEFESFKKEQLAQLEEQKNDPRARAFTTLRQRLSPWPKDDVRYSPTIDESIERLKAAKLQDLKALHAGLWGGTSAELAIVGDFAEAATKAELEQVFGGWRSPKAWQRIAQPYKASQPGEELIATPDKEMAILAVGHSLELRDDDPDYPALTLLNHLLGGAVNSRLFERLRQKEGISYGVFSAILADSEDKEGAFVAGALCAPQNADKAMNALLEEIDKLVQQGVAGAELADAKKSYAASWDNEMAQDDFIVHQLVEDLYLGRTLSFWANVNAKIQALTPADIKRVAQKYVHTQNLTKIKAGDFSKKP
jgi:zinc protease